MLKITVTASGPRGCGKSTHLEALRKLMAEHGYVIASTDNLDVEGFTCTHPSSARPPRAPATCRCGSPIPHTNEFRHLCDPCLVEWERVDIAFEKEMAARGEG